MQISSCILTFSFRRPGWICSSPGDLVILILSTPSSSAVTWDWTTQCVTSLWCTNRRWTLLSGSFPLKHPPFSRWWERGANTLLSHTPTLCLLKMYFLMPTLKGRNRSAAISLYSFFVVNLYNLLAFCFPHPKDSESQKRCYRPLLAADPSCQHTLVSVAACPSSAQPRPTWLWAGGTEQTSPLYHYIEYLWFPLSLKMSLCSNDSCPGGLHKWDVNPFLFHGKRGGSCPLSVSEDRLSHAFTHLHFRVWGVFLPPSCHCNLHLSPSSEGCYSFERA